MKLNLEKKTRICGWTAALCSTMTIDVIYYYVIWTDNGSTLPEAITRRQEGKYPMIEVLLGCIFKLSLYAVNSVLILCRTGNMQSAILLSFVAFSSPPPCGLQSTHPTMPCYISPYVVHTECSIEHATKESCARLHGCLRATMILPT